MGGEGGGGGDGQDLSPALADDKIQALDLSHRSVSHRRLSSMLIPCA